MATDEATPLDITVVRTLRLPRFWTADPQLWFAQVESQFTTSHITSQAQRFHHVVAALPPETAVDIRDIILEPPTTNRYDNLKAEFIKRTSASEPQRLQQLLTSEELGDRTPSQLLRRLQQLLGERAATFDPTLLWELFLQRLPNNKQENDTHFYLKVRSPRPRAGDLRSQRCQQEHRRRRTTCVSSPSPPQPHLEWYKSLPSLTEGRILVRQGPPKRRGVDPLRPLKPSCLEVGEFLLAPLKAPGNSVSRWGRRPVRNSLRQPPVNQWTRVGRSPTRTDSTQVRSPYFRPSVVPPAGQKIRLKRKMLPVSK
ncbi:uncharacterized protein ISCGN_016393 [Ixodes scapularis]